MIKLIFIILIISFILLVLSLTKGFIKNNNYIESFKDKLSHEIKMGVNPEHFEMAYTLCQSNPDVSCRKYIHHYDGLRNTFHKLKDDYCQNNPTHCTEIGL